MAVVRCDKAVLDAGLWAYTETAGFRLNAGTIPTAQQAGWTVLDAVLVQSCCIARRALLAG